MIFKNLFKDKRPLYGQDPFVTKIDGNYILCESIDEERIALSTLKSLTDLERKETVIVWDHPGERQVWAPEIHKISGLWYIFYSESDGENCNHRPRLLMSNHPFGEYHKLTIAMPDFWGIDMTTFQWKSARYAVWSGWEKNGDEFPQNLYIGEMTLPWYIKERVQLSIPELEWETSVRPILEGPQAWIRNGKLSILYSANASWTQEYCTGMLTLTGRDPLNPGNWEKRSVPILLNAGHGCMIDEFFVYHRKMSTFPGWSDREITSVKIWEP